MSVDLNGDGQLDYHEFIAAALSARTIDDAMIRQAFNILDKDGDGQIDATELQYAFNAKGATGGKAAKAGKGDTVDPSKRGQGKEAKLKKEEDNKTWESFIGLVDKDGDQQISFDEFSEQIQAFVRSYAKGQ